MFKKYFLALFLCVLTSLSIHSSLWATLELNTPAPDFEVTTMDGQTIRLSDLRGQKVFIDFWASWCPPCKGALRLSHKHIDDYKKLCVPLFICTGDDPARATQYIQSAGFNNMTFAFDSDGEISKNYRIRGIPQFYIVDEKGMIAWKSTGVPRNDETFVINALKSLN